MCVINPIITYGGGAIVSMAVLKLYVCLNYVGSCTGRFVHKHFTHAKQSDESQAKKEAFRPGKTNTKIEHSQREQEM